ncbi:MAG: domain containing protein [Myxococcales bacterium]|nr:domain containing protein [Myxococcales bacterium]
MLVLAIAVGAGCTEDVPTLYERTTAMVGIELAPPDDHIPAGLGHYRWELVEAPPRATTSSPTEETAAIAIVPTTRGIYVYDRWFVGQAAEQLSYHVVITVEGAAPTARVVGPTMVAAGAATTLDGSTSASPEHRQLTFQWRLAVRPESSATVLADTASATLTLVPDVRGEYGIELRVFDGELWSQLAMATLAAH